MHISDLELNEEQKQYVSLIERVVTTKILPKIVLKEIRRTKQFQEWITQVMTYTRIMELSLTWHILRIKKSDIVLDIGSPKLLSLLISLHNQVEVYASDMDDYFLDEFTIFQNYFDKAPKGLVFDCHDIPFVDNYFNKIYSVSVIEHIENGQSEVIDEMYRVLKPAGVAVITLPAWIEYVEEWLKTKTFYWATSMNNEQKHFYQRRYDLNHLQKQFCNNQWRNVDFLFIAEHPLIEPYFNDNGMLVHNAYIAQQESYKRSKFLRKFPFYDYHFTKGLSDKCHYITLDPTDRNIRQVVVRLVK
jgi:SAM-dependent methyltransferase